MLLPTNCSIDLTWTEMASEILLHSSTGAFTSPLGTVTETFLSLQNLTWKPSISIFLQCSRCFYQSKFGVNTWFPAGPSWRLAVRLAEILLRPGLTGRWYMTPGPSPCLAAGCGHSVACHRYTQHFRLLNISIDLILFWLRHTLSFFYWAGCKRMIWIVAFELQIVEVI